ncbi:dephospho-CoA kinase [Candidatus Providencia siddallii]|uniref:Dephospho-CoA kinase n=1 Tax=Candidatus Providencia siddallii TaxID=1715285 RepID=A0ABM9NP19_9GAMM
MAYVIALTGGIGSGKTTISNEFFKLGVPIIDADIISRKIIESNTIVYKRIIHHFGKDIVNNKNCIDRNKLRKIIFSNIREKKWLESQLFNLIQKETEKQIQKIKYSYVLWVVPLLIEKNIFNIANRILVVDATKNEQISRVIKRDKITKKDVNNILKTQVNRKKRIYHADDIITNHTNDGNLKNKVKILHEKYLKLKM